MDRVLDIANPKYIAEISYLDKQETIYFSIFKEETNYSGMFVKKESTEVGYKFRTQDIEEFMKEYKDVFNINNNLTSDSISKEILTKSNDDLNKKNDNTIDVEIISKSDSTSLSGMPIKLTTEVTGEYDKDIQYHWILENDEGF